MPIAVLEPILCWWSQRQRVALARAINYASLKYLLLDDSLYLRLDALLKKRLTVTDSRLLLKAV